MNNNNNINISLKIPSELMNDEKQFYFVLKSNVVTKSENLLLTHCWVDWLISTVFYCIFKINNKNLEFEKSQEGLLKNQTKPFGGRKCITQSTKYQNVSLYFTGAILPTMENVETQLRSGIWVIHHFPVTLLDFAWCVESSTNI